MLGKLASFGKGAKGIIGGMILGIFLLPAGVYMQYCAANQMKYHKVYEKKAKVVQNANDQIIEDGTLIKTEGEYKLSNGPYSKIKNPKGNIYSGTYITYSVTKYIVKQKESKDDDGKVKYSYSWTSDESASSSPDDLTVTVNGFTVKMNKFRQVYIDSQTKHYTYNDTTGARSKEMDGTPSGATEDDWKNNVYAYVLSGRLWDSTDKDMTICGVASKGSADLSPKEKKMPLSPAQKMLVIGYPNITETRDRLEKSAAGERLGKFIAGALCFMFGFTLLLAPIIKLLNFIPVIGDFAIGIIYAICAVTALILSVIFYILFAFIWVIVGILAAVIIGLIVLSVLKKKKATA